MRDKDGHIARLAAKTNARSLAINLPGGVMKGKGKGKGNGGHRKSTPEGVVLKACLDLLKARGVMAWRNNTGAIPNATGRPVRFGLKGSSDILGVFGKASGRFLACECKRPGGKLSPAQRGFLWAIKRAGGVAVMIDDPTRLSDVLDTLAIDPWAEFHINGEVVT